MVSQGGRSVGDVSEVPVRAQDPRPARTRAAILGAVERLRDLPGKQVTVSAIANDAGVSRSVFYAHFSGLDELLSAVLDEAAQSVGPASNVPADWSARQLTEASLTRLVAHVESRSTFYTAALVWKPTAGVHDAAVAAYARRIRNLTDSIRDLGTHGRTVPSAEHTDFAATFVAGGFIAALTDWLRTGRTTPSATLVQELLAALPPWFGTDEITPTETEHPSCHV